MATASAIPTIPTRALSSKPSWIGRPPAPKTNSKSTATMKQSVRVAYRSQGLRPPVYIVSSLTDPQWEPTELHSTVQDNGELEFWRQFDVEEGEYQYKFRLGPGDWWTVDEGQPSVQDDTGNRNNLILVKAPEPPKSEEKNVPISQTPQPTPVIESSPRHSTEITQVDAQIPMMLPAKPSDILLNKAGPRPGPIEPLTPPMSPEIHTTSPADADDLSHLGITIQKPRPASIASDPSEKSLEEGLSSPDPKDAATPEINIKTPSEVSPKHPAGILSAIKYFLITFGTWIAQILGGGARATGVVAVAVGLAAAVYKIRDMRDAVAPAVFSMLYPQGPGRRHANHSSMV